MNIKTSKQLGMPFGTAMARLRKQILFKLIQKCQEDICYQCGSKIETLEELSIEHKKPWLDVDISLFWDLDNIAFSHYLCNVKAGRKNLGQRSKHGTRNSYNKWGCRCKECIEISSNYRNEQRYKTGRRKRPKKFNALVA